jgi:hypothetical protein
MKWRSRFGRYVFLNGVEEGAELGGTVAAVVLPMNLPVLHRPRRTGW